MISNTLYNHDLHVISVRDLVFYELEKKLFVTPAEYMPQRNLILASFLYVIGITGMIESIRV